MTTNKQNGDVSCILKDFKGGIPSGHCNNKDKSESEPCSIETVIMDRPKSHWGKRHEKHIANAYITDNLPIENDSGDDSDDYRKKRSRNNMAVKKSRVKSKQKTDETMIRVNQLKSENTVLEEKVKQLTKELNFLKELFLAHAGNNAEGKFQNVDLQKIFGDSSSSD